MYNTISTYRIQFHKDFNLDDFEKIIPYLIELGVKTVYASPILTATPGSTHGYDVTDPLTINPEIGTIEQLKTIITRLKTSGIGWIQDIVPNHMAFDQHNRWLMDVLEKGKRSVYANYFDILWDSPVYDGRIMVPFLGAELNQVVADKQLTIAYQNNQLVFFYGDQAYPLHLRSYATLTRYLNSENLPANLLPAIEQADSLADVDQYASAMEDVKKQYADDLEKIFTGVSLTKINNDLNLLSSIAIEQAYQLCFWQETDKQINYRRFFTVNGLICLNIQRQEVFDHYHQLIKQLLDEHLFEGLRVDHVDGLFDPERYLNRLRALAGDNTYIIVEKILERGEPFPNNWPVEGNTGYDFLAIVNNLFTNNDSEHTFSKLYQQLIKSDQEAGDIVPKKKALILYEHMAGELDNLYQLFVSLNLVESDLLNDVDQPKFKDVIAGILIRCPVYRYYGNSFPLKKSERESIKSILKGIVDAKPDLAEAVEVFKHVLLKEPKQGNLDYNSRVLQFYQRLMQFTGPIMAKGVEDTLMYTFNRFINHNEVGDSPEAFGINVGQFHEQMVDRQKHWPLSMNATSTHDTKRGEDVRTKLNVLTDMPDAWLNQVTQWQELNASLKTNNAPDVNDEYFIYQTLIASKPLPEQDQDDFNARLLEYLEKAFREAKRKTTYAEPDGVYEAAVKSFALKLLDRKGPYWSSFLAFQQKIATYGVINSLSQTVLKYTCPGMPDLYQGCELWDYSLVDPDNRRPVDYDLRAKLLAEIKTAESQTDLWKQLWENNTDPQIKLAVTNALLKERAENLDAFYKGEYLPLEVQGKYKDNIIAFARSYELTWYVIVLPLHLAHIINNDEIPDTFDWEDTRVLLPKDAPQQWEHCLFGIKGITGTGLMINSIFKPLTLALLKLNSSSRGAGILMHISSLPSPFGIGDIGPEAYNFADFLHSGGQKFWQLLPVNTVQPESGYSPYSSSSSIAGNTLLISPQLLAKDGLLTKGDIKKYRSKNSHLVDFKEATKAKTDLFEQAYHQFLTGVDAEMKQQFETFKTAEAYWLEDYTLYEALKSKHIGAPWYTWPKEYKLRSAAALKKIKKQESATIEKTKWLQFIFAKQWIEFKAYCHQKGIQLVGDIPFYVSYDSADVWSQQQFFKLGKDGNMAGIAGVPPDYFSADGQLWGMPVYNWDEMEKAEYSWWIQRIKKNLEYFDWIRLDHFRAFVNYWDVPAGEKTAVNGQWMPGPGKAFFKELKKQLGKLHLVAEDLGDITKEIYDLRDEFELPGMRVLQFAFGDDLATSVHAPHNFTPTSFAYTGTHDNNTTRGWFETDISKSQHKLIENYTGLKPKAKNINKAMIRMVYASIADTVIVPMQDVLGLDGSGRMNVPSSEEGNWGWRLSSKELTKKTEKYLKKLTTLYNR